MDDESKELLLSASELLQNLSILLADEDVNKEGLRMASHSLKLVHSSVKCVLRGLEMPE